MSTNTHAKIMYLTLAVTTIAGSVLISSGCSPSPSDEPPRNEALPATETRSPAPAEPFSIGDTRFASQQEFIDKIRPRCATQEPRRAQRIAINNRIAAMRAAVPQERTPGSVEIPVYFHILTNAAGTEGNISDDVVRNQIQVLNEAYAGGGPGGTGEPTPFKFRLADIDRTQNDAWFNMSYSEQPTEEERAAKTKLNRPGKGTLNIYTANLGDDTLGWARWPWEIPLGVDGVVILYKTVPNGAIEHYNMGDTATHEVGHWLGLFHTFEGGCDDPGDEVDDTAAERSPASGCPGARDTCPIQGGGDPVDNFMDYSNDACMFRFTAGQSARMDAAHLRYRR